MKSPCEQIMWDVLPSIRAAIAVELVNNRKIFQREVSQMPGITPPAVISVSPRKEAIISNSERIIKEAIVKLADDLIQKGDNLKSMICETRKSLQDDKSDATDLLHEFTILYILYGKNKNIDFN